MNDRIDTDAAGILIGNDLDAASAWAGSLRDEPGRRPASPSNRRYYDLGLIAGLVLYVAWQLW